MDQQQGPTMSHRKQYSIFYGQTMMEKNMRRMCVCLCVCVCIQNVYIYIKDVYIYI